jgi:hypothetical protein
VLSGFSGDSSGIDFQLEILRLEEKRAAKGRRSTSCKEAPPATRRWTDEPDPDDYSSGWMRLPPSSGSSSSATSSSSSVASRATDSYAFTGGSSPQDDYAAFSPNSVSQRWTRWPRPLHRWSQPCRVCTLRPLLRSQWRRRRAMTMVWPPRLHSLQWRRRARRHDFFMAFLLQCTRRRRNSARCRSSRTLRRTASPTGSFYRGFTILLTASLRRSLHTLDSLPYLLLNLEAQSAWHRSISTSTRLKANM